MTQTSAFHFESLVWDWPIAIYLRAYFSAIHFKVNRRCIGYLCLFLSHCRLLFLFMVAEFHF